MASKHEIWELRSMQASPLSVKIALTKTRIKEWIDTFGEDGVYVSFSGGKDSTVLLHIVRDVMGYKNVPAMFVDTGLEYPEIREFVKTFDNVDIVKPKMNFKAVIQKYGYPIIGKETAEVVYNAKRYLQKLAETEGLINPDDKIPYEQFYRKLTGQGEYSTGSKGGGDAKLRKLCGLGEFKNPNSQMDDALSCLYNDVDLVELAKSKDKWTMPYRVSIMLGTFETHWQKKQQGLMPKDGKPSRAKYSQEKYQFFLNAPFDISHQCCNVMKKSPAHEYAKKTGRNPMTAQMADESRLRTQKWLQNGCNGFNLTEPMSNPMAFWLETDVLEYIATYNIPICSVYGEVVDDFGDQIEGQMDLSDYGLAEKQPRYRCTGCQRTGCVFCLFGIHLEKNPNRLERLKLTHPKIYEYLMKPEDEGGLGYKWKIDWINEHGNMNIKY